MEPPAVMELFGARLCAEDRHRTDAAKLAVGYALQMAWASPPPMSGASSTAT
jgi:hypothetical protein